MIFVLKSVEVYYPGPVLPSSADTALLDQKERYTSPSDANAFMRLTDKDPLSWLLMSCNFPQTQQNKNANVI